MRVILCCLLLLGIGGFMSCSKNDPEEVSEEEGTRKAAPEYQAIAEKFARAFIDKDYQAGYDLLSPAFRSAVPYSEYVDGVSEYRDAFDGEVQAGYSASDDPKGMAEFVAESERNHLVEEITIEFSGDIEGEEGAFFCTVWIIDDGSPKVAKFYLED